MHTSGLISSDYPMASTHRDIIPTNARQQARVGSCFKRLLGNKNALGHVFSDYPTNVAVGCRNAFPSTIVGSFRDPSGSIGYPQGHRRTFPLITPWVSIARGIEPEMPLVARRSAHFVTRRLVSCPSRALLATHRGISLFFSFITPWVSIARGIEPEMPLMAR